MRGFKSILAATAVAAVLVAGCSDSTETPIAQVSLALTDAPGDVDSVWVEIEEIYLQGGGRTVLLSSDDADGLGLIELTQLAGSTLDLVEDVQIPAGNYGQLRFVLAGAVLQTEGGEVYTFNAEHPHGLSATGSLTCPSCDNTGIKVLLPGEVADLEAGAHLIVLDFDVSQSFGHVAGGSGGWVMHPVILGAELGFTGGVTGIVDVQRDVDDNPLVDIPECPAGTPRDLTSFVPVAVAQTLMDGTDPFTSTAAVAGDGTFTFAPLAPDEYEFGYDAEIDFGTALLQFTADAPGLLDVTSGGSLELTYTITGASCVAP